ncbi:GNAT family N-acetyltransferase [candidate division KSB1 bacterium]|nr:GNAT family N-acetyltransferase [candidate division KSB1 bacterium]NIR68824.1 GNAT family N-acetyltransferase [candidate division KSB1 bacterium]NIS27187.1 GNAT family N-acetyltransferase [candidate division KSB1 bacterium]NIT74072.1 GNAT family N-acetyltransferase [candidate division KSB1 bacterium]NIU26937.1 GNAT family N-acetyltransferase [candidate division KSB1 bacterium]
MFREVPFRELQQESQLGVLEYEETLNKPWDDFVWGSDNGTLFHTRQFLNYHPSGRFQDASLIITKGESWVALLPAVAREREDEKSLISHAGASMGGVVMKSPQSIKDTFRIVDALVGSAQERAFRKIVLTLPPQIYFARPNNYLDFALLGLGFHYLKREVSSMIPLHFAEEDTLLRFNGSSRRAVRKALSLGVSVRESDDFASFYAILESNLKLRHNVQPTHTLEELRILKEIFPDRLKLFAAYNGDEMIAGVVVFVCNERVALAFYISHNEEHQKYRGVNLLFYEVIRWCIRQQLKFLDFGIFTINMKPNWGLARFKESFGALGIFRDTFIKTL